MTERGTYSFVVKIDPDGTPTIVLEPGDEDQHINVLRRGFLVLELRPGTTRQEAEALAERLRQQVTALAYTELRQNAGPDAELGGEA
jgi:hypothetical protein